MLRLQSTSACQASSGAFEHRGSVVSRARARERETQGRTETTNATRAFLVARETPPRSKRSSASLGEYWPAARAAHTHNTFCSSTPLKNKSARRAAAPRSAAALRSRRNTSVTPHALLDFLNPKKKAAPTPARREPRPTIIPEPSFNIPITLASLAGLSAATGHTGSAGLFGVLGAFLAIQATRVRFVFDDEALEVVISGKQPGDEGSETENAFVGGRNRWAYDTFVNWEFWWPGFPCLVYFKETQTRPEGQIHFFPIIFEGKTLYKVMKERCGPSVGSGGGKVEEEEDDDE